MTVSPKRVISAKSTHPSFYFSNEPNINAMVRTLPLFASCLISLAAHTQCTQSIPNDALVGTGTSMTINGISNAHIWICSASNMAWMEGGYNTIYCGPGQNGVYIYGNHNTIYYAGGNPFSQEVSGDYNTFYMPAEGLVTFSPSGVGNTVIVCADGVTFDYADAPEGCSYIAALPEQGIAPLDVRYDPVTDRIIANELMHPFISMHLLDLSGRVVEPMNVNAANGWSMTALPAGCYIVQAVAKNGVRTQRFVKP